MFGILGVDIALAPMELARERIVNIRRKVIPPAPTGMRGLPYPKSPRGDEDEDDVSEPKKDEGDGIPK